MKEVILNIDVTNVLGESYDQTERMIKLSDCDMQTNDLSLFDVLGVHPPKRAL